MTRVYLIRHGEAEGNIYRRAQGHYESELTAKGLRQVAALAERFRDEHIDALYSSDLKRTQLTAGAITKYHDLPLHTDPRLREISMGPWEDAPFGDMQHFYPEQMRCFNDDPDRWLVDGAETFPQLKERMFAAVTQLAAKHDGGTIVCVSHGMAIRSLLAKLLEVDSAEIFKVRHGDNTAVSLLEVAPEGIRVVYYNNTDHLPPELSTFARQNWWKKPGSQDQNNIWFRRFDPQKYPSKYLEYYRKAWYAVHGSLCGFQEALYLSPAIRHYAACPDAIVTIQHPDGEVVGITELDTERDADEGVGWICLCFVEELYRRQQLGVQLIGHAVHVFRKLGRKRIRLSVFAGNTGAIRFYEEYGFRRIGETEGVSGKLFIMEKEI